MAPHQSTSIVTVQSLIMLILDGIYYIVACQAFPTLVHVTDEFSLSERGVNGTYVVMLHTQKGLHAMFIAPGR